MSDVRTFMSLNIGIGFPAPFLGVLILRRLRLSAGRPAARNLGIYRGKGEIAPFVNRTFEGGVVIAAFLSILTTVPRHCAHLTYFLHTKLRKINALPTTRKLLTLTLTLRRAAPYVILLFPEESFADVVGRAG